MTVCHVLDVTVTAGGRSLAFARQRFTVPLPYPYDDFTTLLWSYPGGERVLQRTDRLCYEWGTNMMDLCHVGNYSDEGAAREYAISARSGLRLLPYVTWMGGTADANHVRVPCLNEPKYRQDTSAAIITTSRQAAPYAPAAYTLGDENRLNYGPGDCCSSPETVQAFREWLQGRYPNIAALNEAWDAKYGSFDEIKPMLLPEAGQQTKSFAPWIEHKVFMDTVFAETHDLFARAIRSVDPGAKVGWDGITGNGWQSGCDFAKLTRNLDLNQVYTSDWVAGEWMRSFKQPGALSGKWGNGVADVEAGWHAFPWDCLLGGDNSVWWWTSWGCDYIPFNPDLSQNVYAKWFFEGVRETASGAGKLLLHARRDESGVGVLYSPADAYAAAVQAMMVKDMPLSGDYAWRQEQEGLAAGAQGLRVPVPAYHRKGPGAGDLAGGVPGVLPAAGDVPLGPGSGGAAEVRGGRRDAGGRRAGGAADRGGEAPGDAGAG